MTTFVSVGNGGQPFSRLLDAVGSFVLKLPQPVVVQNGQTPFRGTDCIIQPFVELGEYTQLIAEAELLILHAGAGSIIHSIQAGKVPVVMPRLAKYGEIVDDHQLELARAMAALGKVILAEEAGDLEKAVEKALQRRNSTLSIETPRMVRLIDDVLQEYAVRFKGSSNLIHGSRAVNKSRAA